VELRDEPESGYTKPAPGQVQAKFSLKNLSFSAFRVELKLISAAYSKS
jgi:hypothetical protein